MRPTAPPASPAVESSHGGSCLPCGCPTCCPHCQQDYPLFMLSGRKSKLLSSEQPTLTATCLVSNEEASTSSFELEESASCCGTYRYRTASLPVGFQGADLGSKVALCWSSKQGIVVIRIRHQPYQCDPTRLVHRGMQVKVEQLHAHVHGRPGVGP